METGQFYDFGPFRLDAHKHLLLRANQTVALTPKALDTLLLLVENSDRVMEKDELMKTLWPNSFVEEANLAQHISTLRKVLGESPGDHHYIVTVPGRGYQFVAEVRAECEASDDELIVEKRTVSRIIVEENQSRHEEGQPSLAAGSSEASFHRLALPQYSSRLRFSTTKILAGAGVVAAITLALLGLEVELNHRRGPAPSPEPKQQQLTYNSSEVSLMGAAISPDGRFLAYIDRKGIFLRTIQTGETHSVRPPEGFSPSYSSLRWFPDNTKLLVGGRVGAATADSLWAISIFGETPRRIQEGTWGTVSPDGSWIAYLGPTFREIWLMGASGDVPRKIVTLGEDEQVRALTWAPTGGRIAYVTYRDGGPGATIATCDLNGEHRTEILAGLRMPWRIDLAWAAGGRIFYPYQESRARLEDADLWEVRADPQTGAAAGGPKRVTDWIRSTVWDLSLTADGHRLVFLSSKPQTDVYVGELQQNGRRMSPPRRLTLNDANDWPQGWTTDSRFVLFHSDRRGTADIFKQDVRGGDAQVIMDSPDEETYPRATPDGKWVMYWSRPHVGAKLGPLRFMRIPTAGGPAEVVLTPEQGSWFRCPMRAGASCVLGENSGEKLTFFALDPLRGKGPELRSVHFSPNQNIFWDLSPDGLRVAIAGGSPDEDSFQVVPLHDGPAQMIAVRGWNNVFNVVWAADGKSFFAFTRPQPVPSLLNIDFNGNVHVLWKSEGAVAYAQEPVPSPDGRFLAFEGATESANAWMIENF
ncbi:MAG TPA: winged helix-turn-helix domain-containing protein [Terriglobia bacterium]|nr:winged helix-turn-helix domain-containing protein [Terriglobia bacterium]